MDGREYFVFFYNDSIIKEPSCCMHFSNTRFRGLIYSSHFSASSLIAACFVVKVAECPGCDQL